MSTGHRKTHHDLGADSLSGAAAQFAALGEPIRLQIVDELTTGDLSPGELSGKLRVSSNLLAHHLGVLDATGIIRRARSEGDRRRSYLQLSLEDPTVAAVAGIRRRGSGLGTTARRVVFVCTANSARSQFAAATWNQLSELPATSAGTHPAPRVHPRTLRLARRHHLELTQQPPVHIDDVLTENDLVVAVCDNAHEGLDRDLLRLHWSIPNPVRVDTDDAFEVAYMTVLRRVRHLVSQTISKEAS